MHTGLILVGGLGTQLRPLTLSKAKPLIEFANKPQLLRLLELLQKAGATEAVLAINYRPEIMAEFLEQYSKQESALKITLSQEREPLGTAGPLALAKDHLNDGEPFFVLNCDVACEFNLRTLLDFHQAHGKVGTIMVTPVDEPAKYGKSVVVPHETGLIDRFVEHGRTFAGNLINAGVYIFSPSIFDRIALRPTSMEKEVLPALAAEEQLYCHKLSGFWMNVRRRERLRTAHALCHCPFPCLFVSCALPPASAPDDDSLTAHACARRAQIKKPPSFLQGTSLYLAYVRQHRPAELMALGGVCSGNVILDESAQIGKGCKLGPDVIIGPGCVVEDGARLARCILLEGARVAAHAVVLDSILGWRSAVGAWTRIEGVSVLGEDVHVGAELCINGALILPHKSISDSVTCARPRPGLPWTACTAHAHCRVSRSLACFVGGFLPCRTGSRKSLCELLLRVILPVAMFCCPLRAPAARQCLRARARLRAGAHVRVRGGRADSGGNVIWRSLSIRLSFSLSLCVCV